MHYTSVLLQYITLQGTAIWYSFTNNRPHENYIYMKWYIPTSLSVQRKVQGLLVDQQLGTASMQTSQSLTYPCKLYICLQKRKMKCIYTTVGLTATSLRPLHSWDWLDFLSLALGLPWCSTVSRCRIYFCIHFGVTEVNFCMGSLKATTPPLDEKQFLDFTLSRYRSYTYRLQREIKFKYTLLSQHKSYHDFKVMSYKIHDIETTYVCRIYAF